MSLCGLEEDGTYVFLSLTIDIGFRFNHSDRKRKRGESNTETVLNTAILTRGERKRDNYLAVGGAERLYYIQI